MFMKTLLLVSVLAISVDATAERALAEATSMAGIRAMEKVFARSESTHKQSMFKIMNDMTPSNAWSVLERSNLTTPALIQVKNHLHGKQSSFRKASPSSGYSGIEGARNMLNEMIYDSMEKYDTEVADCTNAYAKQCAAMEACRSKIAASNYLAAESRAVMAECQSRIDRCERDIPAAKSRRSEHMQTCGEELGKMNAHLKIIEGDIDTLSSILNMTTCKPTLMQTIITFNHAEVQEKLDRLQSPAAQQLVQDTLQHVLPTVEEVKSSRSISLVHSHQNDVPEVAPRTEMPTDPCTDEFGGGVSPKHKRAAKCTLTGKNCVKLQERFLEIQSGIMDEKSKLLVTIAKFEKYRDDVKETLDQQIANDEALLSESETCLAGGTGHMNEAAADADTTAKYHDELDEEMKTKMESCSQNYINFETELCALKKIRGELYKMKGSGHSAFFQDCVVGVWQPKECSKKCGGGEQKLERDIQTVENGGAKCLPLEATKPCNVQACPVDCKLAEWAGFSKCTAACGGGVKQRLREVETTPKHGGKQCGATSMMVQCNNQACEKDCVLGSWTQWSSCSKDCGIGTNKRVKYVISPPEGQGTCADEWSDERLQYKVCHTHECPKLTCDKELDIVLVLDGSGSLGQEGWDAEIKAATNFVEAFDVAGSKAKMSVVLYSGPLFRRGAWDCIKGRVKTPADIENKCKLKSVVSMESTESSDMKAVKNKVSQLTWPEGSTLTSMALYRAKTEIDLGRQDAKSIVVVMTDGKPFSMWRTYWASRAVRKNSRLVWVPVVKYAPLRLFKFLATRRWQENVVVAKDFDDLKKSETVNAIIADICPK